MVHAENGAGRQVPDLFLFFEKALCELKASSLQLTYISIALNLAYNKNKLYDTLGYWSRYMVNFDFVGKGLKIVSPSLFAYDFSRKIFSHVLF